MIHQKNQTNRKERKGVDKTKQKSYSSEYNAKGGQSPHSITFYKEPDVLAVKISKEGIFFNREKYIDWKPDDFAEAFINVLEKRFTVKFEENGN